MMISVLDLWADVGYTENSITQPPIGSSTLPSPDATFTDLHPGRDKLFSTIDVRGEYFALFNMTYLRAVFSGHDTRVFYGWVDSVECISDNQGFEVCRINWHVDYWRTFKEDAVFKEGTVIRRAADPDDRPIQPCPYKYKILDKDNAVNLGYIDPFVEFELLTHAMYWLVFSFTEEDSSHEVTSTKYGCIPVWKVTDTVPPYGTTNPCIALGASGTKRLIPSYADVMMGTWDEKLKIDPTRIKYAGISTISPKKWGAYRDINSETVYFTNPGGWTIKNFNESSYYCFVYDFIPSTIQPNLDITDETVEEISGTTGDEKTEMLVFGLDFETVATLPPFRTFNEIRSRLVLSTTSAYLQFRFTEREKAHAEGLCVTVPCNAVEITENSWSSYVYSGQRDYDRSMKEYQARASAIESALSGLGFGASLGAGEGTKAAAGLGVKAAVGTAAGAAGVGMLAFGAAQAIGSGLTYVIQEGFLNPELQGLQDRMHARQSDGLLLPGAGFDFMMHGSKCITMAPFRIDDYSADIFDNDQELYGSHVQEARESCQSLIEAGGPMAIIGLDVGGDIPTAARNFMRQFFAKGVRLI